MTMPHGPAVSDLFLLSPLSPTSFPGCPPLLTASWAFRVVCVCVCVYVWVCVCVCRCSCLYLSGDAQGHVPTLDGVGSYPQGSEGLSPPT